MRDVVGPCVSYDHFNMGKRDRAQKWLPTNYLIGVLAYFLNFSLSFLCYKKLKTAPLFNKG